MKYDFVDIGTAYFCTSIDTFGLGVNGLLVEPVKEYFDVLPSSETVIKANYAISDSERIDYMFSAQTHNNKIKYVPEKELTVMDIKNKGPISIDGCSSLGSPHVEGGKNQKQRPCNVITFYKLCELYDIKEIGTLKIDTEGHDYIILKQVYEMLKNEKLIVFDKIVCEYNYLIDKNAVEELIQKFEKEFKFKRRVSINIWGQLDLILEKGKQKKK